MSLRVALAASLATTVRRRWMTVCVECSLLLPRLPSSRQARTRGAEKNNVRSTSSQHVLLQGVVGLYIFLVKKKEEKKSSLIPSSTLTPLRILLPFTWTCFFFSFASSWRQITCYYDTTRALDPAPRPNFENRLTAIIFLSRDKSLTLTQHVNADNGLALV